jgi:hypothetical protein
MIEDQKVLEKIQETLSVNKLTLGAQILVGSRLFGYAQESSDFDVRVIGIPDPILYSPAKRGMIVGFDPRVSPVHDTIVNVKIVKNDQDCKYDIFTDSVHKFLAEALKGNYYQLQNLLAPLEMYDNYDPRWPRMKNALCEVIPDSAFGMAASFLSRDLRSAIFMAEKMNKNYAKKLTQITFIKNFILTRNPMDTSENYPLMRDTPVEVAVVKRKLLEIAAELHQFLSHTPARMNIEQTGRFREVLMTELNAWYGEEVFTIPS